MCETFVCISYRPIDTISIDVNKTQYTCVRIPARKTYQKAYKFLFKWQRKEKEVEVEVEVEKIRSTGNFSQMRIYLQ